MTRLLIVDDDLLVRKAMSRALRSHAFETRAVETIEEALAALSAGRFAVVLCDYLLGEHNGLELLTAMQARGDRTVFVLLSGLPESMNRANTPGVAAVLLKPMPIGALAARLTELLHGV